MQRQQRQSDSWVSRASREQVPSQDRKIAASSAQQAAAELAHQRAETQRRKGSRSSVKKLTRLRGEMDAFSCSSSDNKSTRSYGEMDACSNSFTRLVSRYGRFRSKSPLTVWLSDPLAPLPTLSGATGSAEVAEGEGAREERNGPRPVGGHTDCFHDSFVQSDRCKPLLQLTIGLLYI